MSVGLKIRPLTVNKCWKGRRYKTGQYKTYEKAVLFMLPNMVVGPGNLSLDLEFGFSSACADIDNPIKPFLDILQLKYGFNDRDITELNVRKKKCKKGAEYIIFDIKQLEG